MTLLEVLEAIAADLDPAPDVRTGPDGTIEWARSETPFATLDASGDTVVFRLDPTLAAAAARTPDARAQGGDGRLLFAPAVIDGHAADRATAWFEAAYRRATTG